MVLVLISGCPTTKCNGKLQQNLPSGEISEQTQNDSWFWISICCSLKNRFPTILQILARSTNIMFGDVTQVTSQYKWLTNVGFIQTYWFIEKTFCNCCLIQLNNLQQKKWSQWNLKKWYWRKRDSFAIQLEWEFWRRQNYQLWMKGILCDSIFC